MQGQCQFISDVVKPSGMPMVQAKACGPYLFHSQVVCFQASAFKDRKRTTGNSETGGASRMKAL
jgi:hypothetical protein